MMQQIKDLAVKVYGMTDDEVQSLFEKTDEGEQVLKEDAIEVLKQRDAKRMKEFARRAKEEQKPELTTKFDEGYSKAKKEVLKKFEEDLRGQFGLDSEKTGIELVQDIVSQVKESEDIKTHPEYIKLERRLQGEYIPKQKHDEIAQEFDMFKKNVERDKVIGKVIDDARKIFRETNPILSKDPKRAANQESEFLRQFRNYDYEVQEDGNHVIIKDGKRLENENMNAVGFPEFVKSRTKDLFDIQEQSEKGGAGVETPHGTSAGFKTFEEFKTIYNRETDPAKRVKLMDAAKAKGLV